MSRVSKGINQDSMCKSKTMDMDFFTGSDAIIRAISDLLDTDIGSLPYTPAAGFNVHDLLWRATNSPYLTDLENELETKIRNQCCDSNIEVKIVRNGKINNIYIKYVDEYGNTQQNIQLDVSKDDMSGVIKVTAKKINNISVY